MITKVISGAQTGADLAGLVAARELGIDTGGWMPKGCITEEGPRPDLMAIFNMQECEEAGYPARTERNVVDSDGTVVFGDFYSPGSKLTIKLCHKHHKPVTSFPFVGMYPGTEEFEAYQLRNWIKMWNIQILNVAGNRESKSSGIFKATKTVLLLALKENTNEQTTSIT